MSFVLIFIYTSSKNSRTAGKQRMCGVVAMAKITGRPRDGINSVTVVISH